jgi:lipopolysaccharide transport system permease protein
VGQVVPILLQILFWFTPIVYPATIIPSYLRGTMDLNPMFSIVNAYHDVLVYAKAPDLGEIWLTATISVCLMIIGLFMFRRAAPEMVDAL